MCCREDWRYRGRHESSAENGKASGRTMETEGNLTAAEKKRRAGSSEAKPGVRMSAKRESRAKGQPELRELPGGIPYSIVRSGRKTMALQVTRDGRVVVRCPMRVPEMAARAFAESHREWIVEHYRQVKEREEHRLVFTEEEVKRYRETARRVLTEKVDIWAGKMGVTYGRIAIRQQVTRWGSCSGRGNLNFNWMLALMPEELQDYVVVHELAHRREMNHSERFWKLVEEQIPDYKQRRKRLRNYESQIEIAEAGRPDKAVGR